MKQPGVHFIEIKLLNMNNISFLKFICIFLVSHLLLPGKSFAQDKPFQDEVVIMRTYKPKLADANKMEIVPLNEKLEVAKPAITFIVISKIVIPKANTTKIPPVNLVVNKTQSYDRFYVKAGAGNYNGILFNFNYNTTARKNDLLAVYLSHNSGKASPDNSGYMQDILRLSGHKFIGKKQLSGKIYADNHRLHYYGNDTIEWAKDSIRQNLLDIGLNVFFTNEMSEKDKIKYSIGGNFYNLSDAFKVNELGINIFGSLEQKLHSNPVRFDISNSFFNHKFNETNNRNIFELKAKYKLQESKWNAYLGFKVASEADSSVNKFHFYPDIHLEAALIQNFLYLFGEFTGGIENVSYRSVTRENPYAGQDLDIRNVNNQFELNGGFKGNIANKVNFLVKGSFKNLENLYFYVNDSVDKRKFILVYDSGTTPLVTMTVEANLDLNPAFSLFIKGNFFDYNTKSIIQPFHRPDYDLTFTARYNLQKKVYINVDLFAIGTRYAYDWSTKQAVQLKSILDLNAGLTYNFSHTFGIFFNFNNILSQKYTYWNGYEYRGFQFLGGAKINL